ncbi:cell division protein FtsX [Halomonas sp. E19]|uniref:cell division protein FtsX n=1 Tax=Halomonas sp. E19 TaxID=3397247 RepID=UPI004033CDE1
MRLDLAWIERLRHLAELGRRLALALAVLFGLGVLLVVGNTIRLAVESRRQEIEVVMLIGATHAFVRRPFLYSGAWYGLGGGLLAWGCSALAISGWRYLSATLPPATAPPMNYPSWALGLGNAACVQYTIGLAGGLDRRESPSCRGAATLADNGTGALVPGRSISQASQERRNIFMLCRSNRAKQWRITGFQGRQPA